MKPPKYFYFRVKTDSKATKIILEDASDCDVVEVVRCRDCRHRDPEDKKCDSGALERAGCVFAVDDDYYCADGERKDGGQDDGI